MSDQLVHLLPDAIANQIAAGEVVQRPASVVKELLENAVDAGADHIELIIKDSGRTLVQVIDNGCGMSETDARMSLERHATSKLKTAADLFNLHTMGFRGEALASIAAVSQLEIKTRRAPDELGTRLAVEDSHVKIQEPTATPVGTSMAVRNLFYNVPARRKFLKSDGVEMRHIRDEFIRIALAYPNLSFSLYSNDRLEMSLPAGNVKQRLVNIFSRKYEEALVPIQESTDVLSITGYIGKPSAARSKRVGQFFFVNQRFIKSSYLHHAVVNAYDELLPAKSHPFYCIYLEMDPSRIDVNIHPTKQEIKFENERMIYNYLKATIRHGLGKASIMPSIDFETDNVFSPSRTTIHNPVTRIDEDGAIPSRMNADFSPKEGSKQNLSKGMSATEASTYARSMRNWDILYEHMKNGTDEVIQADETIDFNVEAPGSQPDDVELLPSRMGDSISPNGDSQLRAPYQLHQRYIISPIKSGWLLIDQRAAHYRIMYERFLSDLKAREGASQQSLFPETIEMSPIDAGLVTEMLPDLQRLGFDLEEFGGTSFILRGVPAGLEGSRSDREVLDTLIQQYKDNVDMESNSQERLARALARSASIQSGQALNETEMRSLIDRLFACEQPTLAPNGRKCFVKYELDEVERRFEGS